MVLAAFINATGGAYIVHPARPSYDIRTPCPRGSDVFYTAYRSFPVLRPLVSRSRAPNSSSCAVPSKGIATRSSAAVVLYRRCLNFSAAGCVAGVSASIWPERRTDGGRVDCGVSRQRSSAGRWDDRRRNETRMHRVVFQRRAFRQKLLFSSHDYLSNKHRSVRFVHVM